MPRSVFAIALVLSFAAVAQERHEAKEVELKKKETSIVPDKSLAGDVTRKKETKSDAPAFKFDQLRAAIEGQVAGKRREQVEELQKIIDLSQDKKEKPSLYFRLGELYWEESRYYFFEANRKDDEKIAALTREDKAGVDRAESEKQDLLSQSKEYAQKAVEQYSRIVQEYKDFERTDEVLYFLGLNLMEMNDDKRALVAYTRLISKYSKSRYLPDAYLAVGEYNFNNSKSKRELLEKALDAYKNAAKFPENAVYGYAIYKQGWCYFNMNDFDKAMDQFKAVVIYADIAGQSEVEGSGKGKSARAGLVKEARNDFVRAYARGGGGPGEAKEKFGKLAKTADDLRLMMKQLAGLYYEDGKDQDAALAYDMLIKERPTSPDAPGFQGRIVDCVMRTGKKRITVQQVRRLVKIMDDVLKGNPKMDDKDKKALDEARDLSERTTSNLAVSWHNEAKKTRDEETFGFANEVYADYLALFPENPKAYDLRFFWAGLLSDNLNKYDKAGEEYAHVFQQDIAKVEKGEKPGKFMVDAAYNSILAWDEVVKKARADGKMKTDAAADPTKKANIPPEQKGLLDACEKYLKYVEKSDRRVEILYKVARVYYEYNYFDEAVARYAEIALKHPDYKAEDGSKLAEFAANQVLDSFNLLQDWVKVNEWAKKFYAEEKLATGKFREELAKLIEQSSFKLINQLEAKKEYAKAADAYMGFVTDWPKSELADKALFNASIDFFNARMLDRAIEVRKQIVTKYPKSQYVPQTMYALAEGYEAVADFESAASYYESYAGNYEKTRGPAGRRAPAAAKKDAKPAAEQVWDEAKSQDALINAGVFRDGLGQYKQALHNREKYLELWPQAKDAETIEKSIIDLTEKMGQFTKVTKLLEDYEKKYVRDPNKVLYGEGRLATTYEDKLKNPRQARGIYVRVQDYYEKLTKKQQQSLDITALDAVARADFALNDDTSKKYQALKLRWSALQNVGELKGSLATKAKALEELQKTYTRTVSFKSADPAICALFKIGQAYDQFAEALANPPVPKGIPDDLLTEVKSQFDQQAQPVKDKAAEAFTAVVKKSQELDIFNPCTTAALEMLRTKYRPEQFPKMGEDVLELKLDTSHQATIGQDLLTTVQPVPVVSPEKAAELRSHTREVGRDVADLKASDRDFTPPPDSKPEPRSAPRTETRSAPTPTPSRTTPATTGPTKKPASGSDEPEDTL
jgi:tetratricopeptide (TPR) repeat protein